MRAQERKNTKKEQVKFQVNGIENSIEFLNIIKFLNIINKKYILFVVIYIRKEGLQW